MAAHPCGFCGEEMHRVPQAFRVNWNGPKPSDDVRTAPLLDELSDRAVGERMEAYAAKKAARGESWSPN